MNDSAAGATQLASPILDISEAEEDDLDSLTTILARSFHPVNSFVKKCIPDTVVIREWWRSQYQYELKNPRSHVITAVNSNANADLRVAGVLMMRLMLSEDRGAGLWSRELSADHDATLIQPAIDSQVEFRERLFLGKGQTHYFIELFGVDHNCKQYGLGRRLMERACQIADSKSLPIFVQANQYAVTFYQKFGFVEESRVEMPGEIQMTEHLLVRSARALQS